VTTPFVAGDNADGRAGTGRDESDPGGSGSLKTTLTAVRGPRFRDDDGIGQAEANYHRVRRTV